MFSTPRPSRPRRSSPSEQCVCSDAVRRYRSSAISTRMPLRAHDQHNVPYPAPPVSSCRHRGGGSTMEEEREQRSVVTGWLVEAAQNFSGRPSLNGRSETVLEDATARTSKRHKCLPVLDFCSTRGPAAQGLTIRWAFRMRRRSLSDGFS